MRKLNTLETEMLAALEEAERAMSLLQNRCGYGVVSADRVAVLDCVGDPLEKVRVAIANAKLAEKGLAGKH